MSFLGKQKDLKRNVLTDSQLERLKQHQYKSEGMSVLEPGMNVFWKWLVLQMPLWLAPNLITFVGLIINVGTCLILLYFNPMMSNDHNTPIWAYIACGVGLFIYQALDNIDGKQARRTGSATPLGELFDHGCDAISTIFVCVSAITTLEVGSSALGFYGAIVGVALFYMSHWESYVKGRLAFGYLDVTETQFVFIAIYFVRAFFGSNVWLLEIMGFTIRDILLVALLFSTGIKAFQFILSIVQGGPGRGNTTVAETGVLSPLLPLVFWLLGVLYLYSFDYYEKNPAWFLLGVGCACSQLTGILIVSQMTKSKVPQVRLLHAAPLIMYFVQPEYEESALLYIILYYFASLGIYFVQVTMDVSKALGVDVFLIKPKLQQ
eukprot:m.22160 g.22160  ORF g.22160 m.22160 type:complete len:377 (-) comp5426_c0_seq1:87-1217(-)